MQFAAVIREKIDCFRQRCPDMKNGDSLFRIEMLEQSGE
jgi:hypothetical protein